MTGYVYRHFDANGALLYVGFTAYPDKRRTQHKRSHWSGRIASVSLRKYKSEEEARRAEAVAIVLEKPTFNKAVALGVVAQGMRVFVRKNMTCKHRPFIGPLEHPLMLWIKSNGLFLSFVAQKIGVRPEQIKQYARSGTAPLLFQNAVKGLTDGAVGNDAWETVE